jgi:anti-sigma B factor antagonist
MKLESETREGIVVFTLAGSAMQATQQELTDLFSELKEQGGKRMILDLTSTDALPSRVLGQLLGATHAIEEKGGRLAVVVSADPIRFPLFRLGIDRLVSIFNTLDDALAALKAETSSGHVSREATDQA